MQENNLKLLIIINYVRTWEVPWFTLVEINNCHSFRCETNIRHLPIQIIRNEFFICRMEPEPRRKLLLLLPFLIHLHQQLIILLLQIDQLDYIYKYSIMTKLLEEELMVCKLCTNITRSTHTWRRSFQNILLIFFWGYFVFLSATNTLTKMGHGSVSFLTWSRLPKTPFPCMHVLLGLLD